MIIEARNEYGSRITSWDAPPIIFTSGRSFANYFAAQASAMPAIDSFSFPGFGIVRIIRPTAPGHFVNGGSYPRWLNHMTDPVEFTEASWEAFHATLISHWRATGDLLATNTKEI